VPPTHSSRPIVRRDGDRPSGSREGLGAASIPVCQVWLLGPVREPARPSGRCRYWHLLGRGSWSALAPWPADRFATQVPERQAAPCRSIPPTWPKASAPWAAWTQNGAWPRWHTQGRADPLAHQDLGELLPVRLQLDVPDGGRQPLAERHRNGPWARRSCPSSTAWASGPTRWPSALPLGVDQHQPGPISREQLLGRVGDLLQGWSWTVG
jgi:hypothetical protein